MRYVIIIVAVLFMLSVIYTLAVSVETGVNYRFISFNDFLQTIGNTNFKIPDFQKLAEEIETFYDSRPQFDNSILNALDKIGTISAPFGYILKFIFEGLVSIVHNLYVLFTLAGDLLPLKT